MIMNGVSTPGAFPSLDRLKDSSKEHLPSNIPDNRSNICSSWLKALRIGWTGCGGAGSNGRPSAASSESMAERLRDEARNVDCGAVSCISSPKFVCRPAPRGY